MNLEIFPEFWCPTVKGVGKEPMEKEKILKIHPFPCGVWQLMERFSSFTWFNLRADYFECPCLPFLKYSYPPENGRMSPEKGPFQRKIVFQPVFLSGYVIVSGGVNFNLNSLFCLTNPCLDAIWHED